MALDAGPLLLSDFPLKSKAVIEGIDGQNKSRQQGSDPSRAFYGLGYDYSKFSSEISIN